MIQITRKGTSVKIDFTSRIPLCDVRVFGFNWECNTEVYAGLLTNHLSNGLWSELVRVRKEAYEKGWKDAKAKVRKENWFSGAL